MFFFYNFCVMLETLRWEMNLCLIWVLKSKNNPVRILREYTVKIWKCTIRNLSRVYCKNWKYTIGKTWEKYTVKIWKCAVEKCTVKIWKCAIGKSILWKYGSILILEILFGFWILSLPCVCYFELWVKCIDKLFEKN